MIAIMIHVLIIMPPVRRRRIDATSAVTIAAIKPKKAGIAASVARVQKSPRSSATVL
jgi:hypothetical protein